MVPRSTREHRGITQAATAACRERTASRRTQDEIRTMSRRSTQPCTRGRTVPRGHMMSRCSSNTSPLACSQRRYRMRAPSHPRWGFNMGIMRSRCMHRCPRAPGRASRSRCRTASSTPPLRGTIWADDVAIDSSPVRDRQRGEQTGEQTAADRRNGRVNKRGERGWIFPPPPTAADTASADLEGGIDITTDSIPTVEGSSSYRTGSGEQTRTQ